MKCVYVAVKFSTIFFLPHYTSHTGFLMYNARRIKKSCKINKRNISHTPALFSLNSIDKVLFYLYCVSFLRVFHPPFFGSAKKLNLWDLYEALNLLTYSLSDYIYSHSFSSAYTYSYQKNHWANIDFTLPNTYQIYFYHYSTLRG